MESALGALAVVAFLILGIIETEPKTDLPILN
jgi:hypothetical protein